MILLGNDFWNAYNGMNEAKNSKVKSSDYDVFADLEESCSAIFQNKLKQDGIKYSEEELEDITSSYEANIPGSTGKNPDYSLTRETKGLKEVAKDTIEGNDMTIYDINSRKPSQVHSKELRKVV